MSRYYSLAIAGVIVAGVIGYMFALAGEPRSEWFWCTVLTLC